MSDERVDIKIVTDTESFTEAIHRDPTPFAPDMDFKLGVACDLGDTDCESCQ